jgi:Arm DNA-binding domain
MRTRITEALIRQIPPVPRTVFVRDDRLIGFALRVTPAGAKSFIAESRVSGRMRRFTIGAASRFTVDEARTAARALLADMSSGKDPQTKRRAARSRSDTLAAMLDPISLRKTSSRRRLSDIAPKSVAMCPIGKISPLPKSRRRWCAFAMSRF